MVAAVDGIGARHPGIERLAGGLGIGDGGKTPKREAWLFGVGAPVIRNSRKTLAIPALRNQIGPRKALCEDYPSTHCLDLAFEPNADIARKDAFSGNSGGSLGLAARIGKTACALGAWVAMTEVDNDDDFISFENGQRSLGFFGVRRRRWFVHRAGPNIGHEGETEENPDDIPHTESLLLC